MKTSTSYELLMTPQLSIFSFVRSQEMQFFFHKCVWSLELLTFRSEKKDPSFVSRLFPTPCWEPTAANKDWIRAFLSPSPLQAIPAGLSGLHPPPVWNLNNMVESTGACWGLCRSRRIRPRKVPCAEERMFSFMCLLWVKTVRHGKVTNSIAETTIHFRKWQCVSTSFFHS